MITQFIRQSDGSRVGINNDFIVKVEPYTDTKPRSCKLTIDQEDQSNAPLVEIVVGGYEEVCNYLSWGG